MEKGTKVARKEKERKEERKEKVEIRKGGMNKSGRKLKKNWLKREEKSELKMKIWD